MIKRLLFTTAFAGITWGADSSAQATQETSGAVQFSSSGGLSLGFPAVRAAVAVPGLGSAVSPEKKTLPAVGVGVSVRAWRYLVPFADFSVIDTGKAFAQVGSLRSEVQADTYALHGGVRLIGVGSRIRPYAQFGGGVLRQDLKGTFYQAGRATPASGSGAAGSVLFGGGVQMFLGPRWGSSFGVDGFRVARPLNGGGQVYSRVHFGLFYQTKSAFH